MYFAFPKSSTYNAKFDFRYNTENSSWEYYSIRSNSFTWGQHTPPESIKRIAKDLKTPSTVPMEIPQDVMVTGLKDELGRVLLPTGPCTPAIFYQGDKCVAVHKAPGLTWSEVFKCSDLTLGKEMDMYAPQGVRDEITRSAGCSSLMINHFNTALANANFKVDEKRIQEAPPEIRRDEVSHDDHRGGEPPDIHRGEGLPDVDRAEELLREAEPHIDEELRRIEELRRRSEGI